MKDDSEANKEDEGTNLAGVAKGQEFEENDIGPPPSICVRAGHYQANPALFEPEVKAEIVGGKGQ